MAEEVKEVKKEVTENKDKKEKKPYVNGFIAWGSIILELAIVFLIAFLACRI